MNLQEYGEDAIMINVGGRVYKVNRELLLTRKNTLLESVAKGKDDIADCYKSEEGAYFFDRQPDVFHAVIKFYETGELHLPLRICTKIVEKEIKFWNIRDIRLEPCCWMVYNSNLSDFRDLHQIKLKCKVLEGDFSYYTPFLKMTMTPLVSLLQSIFTVLGKKHSIGKVSCRTSILLNGLVIDFVYSSSNQSI